MQRCQMMKTGALRWRFRTSVSTFDSQTVCGAMVIYHSHLSARLTQIAITSFSAFGQAQLSSTPAFRESLKSAEAV
jgi:hypothetical protein